MNSKRHKSSSQKRRKRKKKKTDEDEGFEEIVHFSPGFFRNGFVFEQVENSFFAQGETDSLVNNYIVTTKDFQPKTYQPVKKCPWPLAEKPLNYGSLSDLWNEVRQFIYEHLFLPEEALYDVLTAWVLATWTAEIWSSIPYIFFYGPAATGKTRGLEVLQRISYRGMLASNISPAALFRSCDLWHPTLFLDETEMYSLESKREVIGLLNSGYRKGESVIRARVTEGGTELEIFDVFGFKALAGTRHLAQTLTSRCILIRMLKARRKVELLIDEKKAKELRGKLLEYRFNTLTAGELSELCELFSGRAPPLKIDDGRLIELFTPLLAVANDGHETILKYAQKTYEIRQFEEKATEEAEMVEILTKCDLKDNRSIVLTKDLAERFNLNRSDKDKYSTRSIGWIMSRLGFVKMHTKIGNGWKMEEDRLRYLQQIYGIEPPSLEKVQEVQQVHQPEERPFFKACVLCGKPIWTDDWVSDQFTNWKPAHPECYEEQKQMLKKRG